MIHGLQIHENAIGFFLSKTYCTKRPMLLRQNLNIKNMTVEKEGISAIKGQSTNFQLTAGVPLKTLNFLSVHKVKLLKG